MGARGSRSIHRAHVLLRLLGRLLLAIPAHPTLVGAAGMAGSRPFSSPRRSRSPFGGGGITDVALLINVYALGSLPLLLGVPVLLPLLGHHPHDMIYDAVILYPFLIMDVFPGRVFPLFGVH